LARLFLHDSTRDRRSQGKYKSWDPGSPPAAVACLALTVDQNTRFNPLRCLSSWINFLIKSLSRVYLGMHYPADVLAGWTAGLVWGLGVWAFYLFTGTKDYPNVGEQDGRGNLSYRPSSSGYEPPSLPVGLEIDPHRADDALTVKWLGS
jgi:hypothetical protein